MDRADKFLKMAQFMKDSLEMELKKDMEFTLGLMEAVTPVIG